MEQHDIPDKRSRPDPAPLSVAEIRRGFLDESAAEGLILRGQLKQDLLALVVARFKRNGYFVEFGATDGEKYSNTNLLEKTFGWTGILAEPAIGWHKKLRRKRSCIIDERCVWRESGATLTFEMSRSRTLSTIAGFGESDQHAPKRRDHERIQVETVSLRDLLDGHGAPEVIDYLSVDTEGSEFEILDAFDFARYRFNLITVEHNFTDRRADIHALLTGNGYARILEDLSAFDDWYIPARA